MELLYVSEKERNNTTREDTRESGDCRGTVTKIIAMLRTKNKTVTGWLKFSLWFIIPLSCWIIFLNVIYINSETTCAKFFKEGNTRGTKYMHYSYTVESKKYTHLVDFMVLKNKSLEDMKKVECVTIEYSVWFPTFSRVIDKRIVTDKCCW